MTAEVRTVFGGLFLALGLASLAGLCLARSRPSAAVDNLNARVRAWWVMIVAGGIVLALGRYAVAALLAALALAALAEFSGRSGWLALVPVQFALAATGWLGPALLAIPLLCLLPAARGQRLGLLLCAYPLSAIVTVPNPTWIFYFVLIVQASDVLQYLCGRLFGRHPIAPKLSPSKTVEGLVGGIALATALGAALSYLTPFTPLQAAAVALAVTQAGFFSGLLFSAIKRHRGIKDWGTAIAGHGGVLDRIDSLCLSAPLYAVFIAALRLPPAA